MKNKLPGIFKNPNISTEGNNKISFYSYKDNAPVEKPILKEDVAPSNQDLDEFFNILVEISTRDNVYNTKIIAIINDHILTSNNDRILIKDIISVKIKEH